MLYLLVYYCKVHGLFVLAGRHVGRALSGGAT